MVGGHSAVWKLVPLEASVQVAGILAEEGVSPEDWKVERMDSIWSASEEWTLRFLQATGLFQSCPLEETISEEWEAFVDLEVGWQIP